MNRTKGTRPEAVRHPGRGNAGAGRPRQTAFTGRVKDVLLSIPPGRVATYAQVAALAGNFRAARGVAWILHSASGTTALPWHRVVGSRGAISLGRGRGFETQRRKLRAEGVEVGRDGRIDLGRFLWEPEQKGPRLSRAAAEFFRRLVSGREPV